MLERLQGGQRQELAYKGGALVAGTVERTNERTHETTRAQAYSIQFNSIQFNDCSPLPLQFGLQIDLWQPTHLICCWPSERQHVRQDVSPLRLLPSDDDDDHHHHDGDRDRDRSVIIISGGGRSRNRSSSSSSRGIRMMMMMKMNTARRQVPLNWCSSELASKQKLPAEHFWLAGQTRRAGNGRGWRLLLSRGVSLRFVQQQMEPV